MSVIENMIKNDEEWYFLIQFFTMVFEHCDDEEIRLNLKNEYKKLIEIISDEFNASIKNENYEKMNLCFLSLKSIDKQDILIDFYLQTLEILKPVDFEKDNFKTVDLDYFENNNKFVDFLELIENFYIEQIHDLILDFKGADEILEAIDNKIIKELIPNYLIKVCESNDSVLFLLNLEFFYIKITKLFQSIKSINLKFDEEESISVIFHIYLTEVLYKEKEAFDSLYEIIVRKKKSSMNYLLKGEAIYYSNLRPLKEIASLCHISSLTIKRLKIFKLEQKDFESFSKHFFKKVIEFFEVCNNSFTGIDRFELLKIFSDSYLVVKNCFDDQENFIEFKEYTQERIQLIFEAKIKENEILIKQIIKNTSFKENDNVNTKALQKLLTFLKREVQIVNLNVKGANGHNYLTKIMDFVYQRLYKQYLNYAYSSKEIVLAMNDMRSIIKFVKENKFIEVYGIFEYLCEILEFISVRKEDLMMYYKGMIQKIPDDELKKILKCRMDYKDIRNLFY
ncbi:hypothetical protein GVAV_001350 [Gurleya vavrai]